MCNKHAHKLKDTQNLTTLSYALRTKINISFKGLSFGSINLWTSTHISAVWQVSQVIWQFEHMEYSNIHYDSGTTQSAEPLEGLKNTAVE